MDWGERSIFGKARNYGAIGYTTSRAGRTRDVECEHMVLVDLVMAKMPSRITRAITDHVRRVLELEVEQLDDLERFAAAPEEWHRFREAIREAIRSNYASRALE